MHLKSLALLFSLLLPVVVLSSPFAGGPQDAQVHLYPLTVVVVVEPSPTGDFQKLLHKPPVPDPLPSTCSPKEKKDWKKLDKKCKNWNILHDEFTNHVTPRVTAAIHAAESVLHFPGAGPVHASVQSAYHHHADHDDLWHWTFSFSAPGCGTGTGICVGHAYDAGEVREARIFSDDHRTIFGAKE